MNETPEPLDDFCYMEMHSEECDAMRDAGESMAQFQSGLTPDTRTLLESIRGLRHDVDAAKAAGECASSRQSLHSAYAMVHKIVLDPRFPGNDKVLLAAARIVNAVDHRDVELERVLSCIKTSLNVIESELAANDRQVAESHTSLKYDEV